MKYTRDRGLVILFLIWSTSVFGQYPKTTLDDFTLRSGVPSQNSKTFSSWDSSPYQDGVLWSRSGPGAYDVTSKMNFRILKPNNYSSGKSDGYPMIVHLAGCNEAGRYNCSGGKYSGTFYDDNDKHLSASQSGPGYKHLRAVKENRFPGFVLFPQADYSGWENGINNATSAEIKKVIALIERISDKYNINKSKIYIHGISNGGKGVWDIINRRPDLFAAAMPISSSSYDIFSRAGHMPIWVFHGSRDNIFSANGTKQGVDKMNSKGGQVKYSEYNVGHSAWLNAYREGSFYSWLLAQDQRKIYPYFNKTKIENGTSSITLAISPGFQSYQWYKNGSAINGANAHKIKVYSNATYKVRFKRDGRTIESFPITLGGANPNVEEPEEPENPPNNDDDCNTNVAFNKSATQSSTYLSRNAQKAVDNNTNGDSNRGSVTMTQSQNQAWWELDLGKVYDLDYLKIYNRTDCCKERLNQHYVLVSEKPFNSKNLNSTLSQSGVSKYFVKTASEKMSHNINRKGRYIRVQLKYRNFLSLSEVKVYSCSSTNEEENNNGGGGDENTSDNDAEVIYRINAGGNKLYVDGIDWASDTKNNPHPYLNTYSTNASSGWNVKNNDNNTSAPDILFGTQRYDGKWASTIKYHFPVSNGTYDLKLFFAEKPETNPYVGQRVFGIKIEDRQILNGFDIYKTAGKGTVQINYQVVVNDGKLTVELTREKGEPLISGLEVLSYQGPPPPEFESLESTLTLFPNPANSVIKINTNQPDLEGVLRIMDQSGRIVLEKHGFKDYIEVELDSFASGIYNVILQTSEQVQATRFVKE